MVKCVAFMTIHMQCSTCGFHLTAVTLAALTAAYWAHREHAHASADLTPADVARLRA